MKLSPISEVNLCAMLLGLPLINLL